MSFYREYNLSSRKFLWIAPAIIMIVCLDLIVAKFLLGKFPVLTVIVIVIISVATLATVPSSDTKRAYKTLFLATLFASTGFTVGLYTGLFESLILHVDSWIDISHSAAIFHLKNNGLTDWIIEEVKISNITFTLKYPAAKRYLGTGDTAHLIIYYSENTFQWIPSTYAATISWEQADPFHPFSPMEWPCSVKGEVSPSTFQNGSRYKVVFATNGVLKHSFDTEAKLTLDEELSVTAIRWLYENSMQISVRFNNTGNYFSYIYTIQIANVTFYFEPPLRIYSSDDITFNFGRNGFSVMYYGYYGDIYANATVNFSMFEIGTTYDILARTMTNNLYITSVTI